MRLIIIGYLIRHNIYWKLCSYIVRIHNPYYRLYKEKDINKLNHGMAIEKRACGRSKVFEINAVFCLTCGL